MEGSKPVRRPRSRTGRGRCPPFWRPASIPCVGGRHRAARLVVRPPPAAQTGVPNRRTAPRNSRRRARRPLSCAARAGACSAALSASPSTACRSAAGAPGRCRRLTAGPSRASMDGPWTPPSPPPRSCPPSSRPTWIAARWRGSRPARSTPTANRSPASPGFCQISGQRDRRNVAIQRGRMGSYAVCISRIRNRQRRMKIRRCSASGIHSAPRWRTRKYWRTSSKAGQNWAAATKLPNPRIG